MKRSELKRKTPMRRGKAPARRRAARKPPPHGFPEQVRIAVARRSGYRCEAGSEVCTGKASHFHHRKLRRSKDHRIVNCLHVCSACHTHIHAHPTLAYLMGWMVQSWQEPEAIPVKRGSRAT